MKVNELSELEKPSSKLQYFGTAALSNAELIQIITGARDTDISNRILSEFDMNGVLQVAVTEEIEKVDGVTKSMAGKLVAAIELGKRLSSIPNRDMIKASSPEDIAKIFMEDMRYKTKEHFKILLLNTKNMIIKTEEISIGNISSAIVDPSDVFRPAVKHGAANIVLIHNHPSGNPEPSEADLMVTNKICKAGELLGIHVIDHIIIGDNKFVSLNRERLLDNYTFGRMVADKVKDKNIRERNER